ncbi:MAG: S8 family serine peptidase [Candidatus Thorarchaeota archaeon]
MQPDGDLVPRRGKAILIATILIATGFAISNLLPEGFFPVSSAPCIAIIDSGITPSKGLSSRIVAERSFINVSYGYSMTDEDTTDSEPNGIPHGSYVAKITVRNNPNIRIVNAKVITGENDATFQGIAQAIVWTVNETDAKIINLSLGRMPPNGDPLEEVIEWAFAQGVVVVAAAGNGGQNGLRGTSIESPAVFQEVIAVAAIDRSGAPYPFSGRGPLRNRIIKPDIAALGSYRDASGTEVAFGTSFAAPRVSAAAAALITVCDTNRWKWTPGMIKATLLASASHLEAESWEVGSGRVNVETAIAYVENVPKINSFPMVAHVMPSEVPYNFERLFVNATSTIKCSIFATANATFHLAYTGSAASSVRGLDMVHINQSGEFSFSIRLISSKVHENLEVLLSISSHDYLTMRVRINFDASLPHAIVGFDLTHTAWSIDSIYGQFRSFYATLGDRGVAVEEIRDSSELTYPRLKRLDAIAIMDPCAWYQSYSDFIPTTASLSYSEEELDIYKQYWESGGSLFVVGLSNSSIDVRAANELLSMFNITFKYDRIPETTIVVDGIPSTRLITGLHQHFITEGIGEFDYVGCSLTYSGGAFEIAYTEVSRVNEQGGIYRENKTLMVGLEGSNGARMIVVGSNFFIDNYAINDMYKSSDNERLAYRIVYWLTGLS